MILCVYEIFKSIYDILRLFKILLRKRKPLAFNHF